MPRNGSGVYSADWVNASPNTTIESAKVNAMVADLVTDANVARPVTAGGTAATTAVGGIDNLSTKAANVASAATTDIGAATGRFVHITGTTTITAFGTKASGVERELVFDDVLILTHNATSLILPGGANIITAAGDVAVMVSEGSGNWRCASYTKSAFMPAPQPKTGSGTGQMTIFSGADGAQWTLPADGVYFYYGIRLSLSTGAVSAVNSNIGTVGGTVVGTGLSGEVWRGFSWRIS